MIKIRKNNEGDFCEVSVTNLIDVLFVLLIIFMIMAPAIVRSNLPVRLPKASGAAQEAEAGVELTITSDGSLYSGGIKLDKNELAKRFRNAAQKEKNISVILKADGDVPYGKILEVMEAGRASGLKSIMLAVRQTGDGLE